MIRTILVDDEQRGLNTLSKMLNEYCPGLKLVAECTDAPSAKEKIKLLEPQLVFLDISMPGKSGFDLLAEMDKINFEIIFVTAHNQYAIQAFHYSAVDYLVKPIDEDLLINAVARAEKRIGTNAVSDNIAALIHNLNRTHEMKLCIPSQKGFHVVELNDILYFEGAGSYTNIFFPDRPVICSSKAIHEYEEMLYRSGFMRVHKSYLVNLLHIKEYVRGEGGSLLLSNNKEIEVSRRRKEEFLMKLKEYYKY